MISSGENRRIYPFCTHNELGSLETKEYLFYNFIFTEF